MKKIILFTALAFLLMLPSPGLAEWAKVSATESGSTTFYIDLDTIKKAKGFIYFWGLADYLEPSKYGTLSLANYTKGDCGTMKEMELSLMSYRGSMGKGSPSDSWLPEKEWVYNPPGSTGEEILRTVCEYAKKNLK